MNTPVFSYKNAESFFDKQELDQMGKRAVKAMEELESGTGRGNDFLGWLHLPENYDRDEFERVKKSQRKNPFQFQGFDCYRNRRFLSRGKGCY